MQGLFRAEHCVLATEECVWRNDILAEGTSVPKTDCTLMDQGHLLMPKMYALLYRGKPLTLSPAPHYPLWNETFIIPWCGGANGNRLYSIPSMIQWPLNHGQGVQRESSWVVGAAGHCFIRVHQSESKRKCVGFFLSIMCRLIHEADSQGVIQYLDSSPQAEISPVFCSPRCCYRHWRLSLITVTVLEFLGWRELHQIKDHHRFECRKYYWCGVTRVKQATMQRDNYEERYIPTAQCKWNRGLLKDFSTEQQGSLCPNVDLVHAHMNALGCCCGCFS